VDDLVESLVEDPEDGAFRTRLRALDAGTRIRALQLAKTRIDGLVQSTPEEALRLAEAMVSAVDDGTEEMTIALRARAVARYFSGQTRQALPDFLGAIAGYEAQGQDLEAARVRRSLVEIHLSLGGFELALECGAKARGVFEANGREDLLAGLDLNVGNVHFRMDDYGKARERYESARSRYERLNDELGLAYAAFSLANLEMAANRFDRAQQAYQTARDAWSSQGSLARVADCDYSLAVLEARRGRFAAALDGLEKARATYAEGSKPSGQFYVDLDLADIYFRLDAWRDALDLAERASRGFAELGLEYERAKANALAGLVRYRLGENESALEALGAATETFRRLGNHTQVDVLEIQQATVATAKGEAQRVLPALKSIHRRLRKGQQQLLVELSTLALADALNATGEHLEAERLLTELISPGGAPPAITGLVVPEAYRARAETRMRLGHRQEAMRDLDRAVAEIEGTYSTVPGSDVRLAFFRERREAFCELAWLRAQESAEASAWEALGLVERSRMRSLVDRTASSAAGGGEVERAREHLDQLLSQRLDAELCSWSGVESARRPPRDEELLETQDRLARLARERNRRDQATLVWKEATPRAAAREGEVVVNYFVSGRGACAFVCDSRSIEVVPVEWDQERFDDLCDRLALQCQKQFLGRDYLERHHAGIRRAADAILGELGEALVAPFFERIEGRSLIVVPYGPLHSLPFHALRVDHAYLIEATDVSYAPSMTSLARSRAGPEAANRSIAVAAEVEASLPEARREIEHLQRLFAERCEVLPAGDLLRDFPRLADRAGVVHLAAHGSFQAHHPLFSGMRLGGGFLTAYDIRTMRLGLDLVTLSGCETGRLARVAGEDLSGLQQAFLAAGVRSVVSSLWPVVDREAADLMVRFYDLLAGGSTVRAAMATVQRDLVASGALPVAWAPFVVTGNPDVALSPPPGA